MINGATDELDREHEIAEIHGAIDRASGGSGRLIVVSSTAGMGKTTLLKAAALRAGNRGFIVLAARGSFRERGLGFGLARRLLEPAIARVAHHDIDPVLQRSLLAPPNSGAETDDRAPTDPSLTELSVLHTLVTRLAARAPVLVAVDDCHWGDRATLAWLSAQPWHVEHAPVVVVATMNPWEPGADSTVLDELRAGCATELTPGPLATPAVAALLAEACGGATDRAFAEACRRFTAGNPRLLTDLAAALAERRIEPTAAAIEQLAELSWPRVLPTTYARLRRVSPHARGVAEAVAMLGNSATRDLLNATTGLTAAVATPIVDALVSTGVVVPNGGTPYWNTLGFAAPMLRNALLRGMTLAAREDLHGRVARSLASSGAPASDIAPHLLRGAPVNAPWAATALRAAARAALDAGKPAAASACLSRALVEAPPAETTEVLLELGHTRAYTDVDAAIRHLTKVEAIATHAGQRLRAVDGLADLLALVGEEEKAALLVSQVRDGSAAADDHWAAALAPRLDELELQRLDTAPAALHRIGARPPGATSTDRRAISLAAMVESWLGESRAKAIALAERALSAPCSGPDDVEAGLRAAAVLADAGLLDEALDRTTEMVRLADGWQHRPSLGRALTIRSSVGRRLGRLPDAVNDARRGLELILSCGIPVTGAAAVSARAHLIDALIDTAAVAEASDVLAAAALPDDLPQTLPGTRLLLARGRLRLAQGDAAGALKDLGACGNRLARWRIYNPAVAPWRSAAALAMWPATKVAAEYLANAEVVAGRRWGTAGPIGAALRAHAQISPAPRSEALLAESVRLLAPTPYRFDHAVSLIRYGVELTAALRSERAREVLRLGLDLARQCGSDSLVDQAREAYMAAGGRLRRPTANGQFGLTASQYKVATLAASSKSNREIAEMLFLGRRTVEIHLTNAYRKLGIRGRAQLAAVLDGQPATSG